MSCCLSVFISLFYLPFFQPVYPDCLTLPLYASVWLLFFCLSISLVYVFIPACLLCQSSTPPVWSSVYLTAWLFVCLFSIFLPSSQLAYYACLTQHFCSSVWLSVLLPVYLSGLFLPSGVATLSVPTPPFNPSVCMTDWLFSVCFMFAFLPASLLCLTNPALLPVCLIVCSSVCISVCSSFLLAYPVCPYPNFLPACLPIKLPASCLSVHFLSSILPAYFACPHPLLSVSQSVCLPFCLPVCLYISVFFHPACLPCLSTTPPFCPIDWHAFFLPVCLTIFRPAYPVCPNATFLTLCQSVCLTVCPSACLPTCLSVRFLSSSQPVYPACPHPRLSVCLTAYLPKGLGTGKVCFQEGRQNTYRQTGGRQPNIFIILICHCLHLIKRWSVCRDIFFQIPGPFRGA